MAFTLTLEELNRVNAKRLEERPVRYNAGAGAWQRVTLDFESFLILTPVSRKKQAADWLNLLVLDLDANVLRDQIAADFLDRELSEVSSQQDEIGLVLTPFTDFRADFTESRFLEIAEVAELLQDVQLGIDRVLHLNDELEHRYIMTSALQERSDSDFVSEARRRQAQSWIVPLTTPYI